MSDYTPTTEEIREYVETGGEPRPWVELDAAEEAREKARGEAFDRWLAAHDAELIRSLDVEHAVLWDEERKAPGAFDRRVTPWVPVKQEGADDVRA